MSERRLGLGLVLSLLLAGPVMAQDADTVWPSYNNTLDGERYSPLKEITPQNAARLTETCKVPMGGPGPFETGLVMVDDTLYATASNLTAAIDPKSCAIRWSTTYQPEEMIVSPVNRGVAVLNGRVFRGTGDGRLLALDAKTGQVLWKDVVGNPRIGEFISSAPIAWDGLVFAGTAGGDWGAKGRMLAFDAATGRELWRFDTIPTGKQQGADSWKSPLAAKTGGGALWTSYTLDVSTEELFIPVGNPAPDFAPSYRPGENLYTDSMVVLDARTGALKWWYQLTPHDGLDRDVSSPPALFRDKDLRDLMVFAGKDGFLQAVDRDTHKLAYRLPVSTIEHEGVTPTTEGIHVCPGILGGSEWNGPAYDPALGTLTIGTTEWCGVVTTAPPKYVGGGLFFGGNLEMDKQPGTGWLTSLDAATGKIRWRFHTDAPVTAGVTPTAGGVTFTGDTAGNFMVFDSASGNVLLKQPTGGAMAAGVITYALGGKQFVAFGAGNVSRHTFGELGSPAIHVMGLPDSVAQVSPTLGHGKAIFDQICISCHGADGSGVQDHNLGTIKARKDLAATIAAIKDPAPPMPKLFPNQLSETDVKDVAEYLQNGL